MDTNLQRFIRRQGFGPTLEERLVSFGAWAGGPLEAQARYSDRHAPPIAADVLEQSGVPGGRRKKIIFNAQYEVAQREAYRRGVIGLAYAPQGPHTHLVSFVMGYLLSKSDISTHCPVTLTGAVAHVLRRHAPDAVRDTYLPLMTRMDGTARTGGTWVTEKHSGTNAGGTSCVATRQEDGTFTLSGEKWFASNAGSNIALVLARPEGAPAGNKGTGLYLVADVMDGQPNPYKITGLKDKLGTRGLATVELDLNGCRAVEIAPPPHGLRVMMDALEYSRVHNAMAAAGVTHRAFMEAMCWADNRVPDRRPLCEEPQIQDDLMDMAAEWMASSALAFQAAQAFSYVDGLADSCHGPQEHWMRMITAIAKWRTAESAVQSSTTLINVIGGNGYTKDWPAERLLRDAIALQVWEGPKQVQALELARVILGPDKDGNTLNTGLESICDGLPDTVADMRRAISRELRDLKNNVRMLKAMPQMTRQAANGLLRQAADIAALTLLAHEAGLEMAIQGDDMKLLVARHFHEKQFGDRHRVVFTPGPLQQAFSRLAAMPQGAVQSKPFTGLAPG
jgi:acyl-CoA dehydrogenase